MRILALSLLAALPAFAQDADRRHIVFDGHPPDSLSCDTMVRVMPDDSWVLVMLGGGDKEPDPRNRVYLSRSPDEGATWSPMEPIDLGVKSKDPDIAIIPTELVVFDDRVVLYVATHIGGFHGWDSWSVTSRDSGRTWGPLEPLPGKLRKATFVRNRIDTPDGRILIAFQHYLTDGPTDPRNGVMISEDGGQTFSIHGDIRISQDDDYRGFAENTIVQLADGRIVMLIRADKLGGVLFRSDSTDGGLTWSEARPTDIPNPGSKATLYSLGDDRVALVHNPNPNYRSPLALWVSFDGMATWGYRRILDDNPPERKSQRGGRNGLNYPDGFVDPSGRFLHFAYDRWRSQAIYYRVELPQAP